MNSFHETDLAKCVIKYLCIINAILVLAFVGTNAYWIWENNQWEYEVIEYEAESDGDGHAIINGEGDVNIGTSEENSETEN